MNHGPIHAQINCFAIIPNAHFHQKRAIRVHLISSVLDDGEEILDEIPWAITLNILTLQIKVNVMKKLLSLMCLLLSYLISTQAMAQSGLSPLLEKHYGSVTYISGGIGDEERDEIQLRERDFNLKLLFSERGGSYLGDVDVVLLNSKGETVLDAKSAGPFLLVQLPSGNYGIKVSANGQMQQGKLSITARGKQERIFRW